MNTINGNQRTPARKPARITGDEDDRAGETDVSLGRLVLRIVAVSTVKIFEARTPPTESILLLSSTRFLRTRRSEEDAVYPDPAIPLFESDDVEDASTDGNRSAPGTLRRRSTLPRLVRSK